MDEQKIIKKKVKVEDSKPQIKTKKKAQKIYETPAETKEVISARTHPPDSKPVELTNVDHMIGYEEWKDNWTKNLAAERRPDISDIGAIDTMLSQKRLADAAPFGMAPKDYPLLRDSGLMEWYKNFVKVCTSAVNMQIKHDAVWRHPVLEEVTRSYCEKYLHQPRGAEFGEVECTFGPRCWCKILAENYPPRHMDLSEKGGLGFVGTRFLLPSEEVERNKTGKMPALPGPCLLCLRATTTFIINDCEARGVDAPIHPIVQHHYNKVATCAREMTHETYDINTCLPICEKGFGIVAPFVAFDPSQYTYTTVELPASLKNKTTAKYKCIKETMQNF